ncbi:MAG: hypothetical protein IJF42_01390 [Clostridia bacterium]|nr:hypothetical protein [Clostridia bacterium]
MPSPCVLICVANPASCRNIVEAGMAIAAREQLPITVVSVLTSGLPTTEDGLTMQQLHNITRRCGAELTVFFNDEPALTTAVYARQCNAAHIVAGVPGEDGMPKTTPFVEMIHEMFPQIPMTLVTPDAETFLLDT